MNGRQGRTPTLQKPPLCRVRPVAEWRTAMPTVLVVDDEPAIASLVRDILREEGYEVVTAPDGLRGLTSARAVKPDLVVSDYMMPGLDGKGLALAMQEDPELAAIPLILMSAVLMPAAVGHMVAFVRKPFDLDELVQVVQRCLGA